MSPLLPLIYLRYPPDWTLRQWRQLAWSVENSSGTKNCCWSISNMWSVNVVCLFWVFMLCVHIVCSFFCSRCVFMFCVHSVCLYSHHLSTVLSSLLSCPSFIIKRMLTATAVSTLLSSQTCSNTGSHSMCDAIHATVCSVDMLWCDSLLLYLLLTRN